jgi:hypothetical protein
MQEMKESGNPGKDRVTAKFIPNLPSVLLKMDGGLLEQQALWSQY